jgi:hypothetical protein
VVAVLRIHETHSQHMNMASHIVLHACKIFGTVHHPAGLGLFLKVVHVP